MANKFQKSVLSRLEQEANRQKKPPAADPVAIEKPDETLLQEYKEPIQEHSQADGRMADIGDFLRRETQRQAKNKTFYLDEQVIAAIKSTAKIQHVNDSKLVNDILRSVLRVDS